MAKILLAEDDNNLREIYEARLAAEGYDIVTAQNGEEALVVAKQNKPDLIISDVMMPRISGFEMLDILRNTPELQDTKVIMLTALGQAEDQTRAGKLGANKYLVKSQVTLEDIVNAAASLLADDSAAPAAPTEPEDPALLAPEVPEGNNASAQPAPEVTTETPTVEETEPQPAAAAPAPEPVAAPAIAPSTDNQANTAPEQPEAPVQAAPQPNPDTAPAVSTEVPTDTPEPVTAPALQQPDMPTQTAPAQTAADEEAAVAQQIENFASTIPAEPAAAVEPEAPATTNPPQDTAQETLINEAVEDLTEAVNAPPEPILPPSQKPTPGEASPESDEATGTTPLSQQLEPHLTAAPAEEAEPEPAVPAPAPEPAAAQISGHSTPMTTPQESQESPAETQSDETSAPQPAPTPEQANDYQQVSGKKVIKPINDTSSTGPNLDELLAKESAKETEAGPAAIVGGDAAPATPTDSPAEPQTPAPATENKPQQNGFDPNSIAL